MSSKNITEMGIVQLLAAIFAGEIPEGSEPFGKIKSTEMQRGVIVSPIARRLFGAYSLITEYLHELAREHDSLHQQKKEPEARVHDCKAFQAKASCLIRRQELLHSLLWQAITEEHPVVAGNNATIRNGWLLVGRKQLWNEIVPVFGESSLAGNFIARIEEIVCGKQMPVKEDGLEKVAEGEEVVGSLEDERVRAFWPLIGELADEWAKHLPPATPEEFEKAFNSMTIDQLKRLGVLKMHYQGLIEMATALFWCGVRDTVPVAADLKKISIRRNWEVVKCVPDEDEGEEAVKMIMTPAGPALSIKFPFR